MNRPAVSSRMTHLPLTYLLVIAWLASLTLIWGQPARHARAAGSVPSFSHVVVIVEENHDFNEIIGSPDAPYINNTLAAIGTVFTNSHAITHPSQPNYLDLFSGSDQGVTDDSCDPNQPTFTTPNLGGQLLNSQQTFVGYSESQPSGDPGYRTCDDGTYARRHSPWTFFDAVPASDIQDFSSFPRDFNSLPTVTFVTPNLQDDMHDGSVSAGDNWLSQNIDSYVQWAVNNNSILILTWDENGGQADGNLIPTIIVGAHVKSGFSDSTFINHFSVLHTIEAVYGLDLLGATQDPITDCWN